MFRQTKKEPPKTPQKAQGGDASSQQASENKGGSLGKDILQAVSDGDLKALKKHLTKQPIKVDFELTNNGGNTPLLMAVQRCKYNPVKVVLIPGVPTTKTSHSTK
jgi:hypothetical protein